jgi:hypothetical protein
MSWSLRSIAVRRSVYCHFAFTARLDFVTVKCCRTNSPFLHGAPVWHPGSDVILLPIGGARKCQRGRPTGGG